MTYPVTRSARIAKRSHRSYKRGFYETDQSCVGRIDVCCVDKRVSARTTRAFIRTNRDRCRIRTNDNCARER
jgi:hypothetical protein